MGHVSDAQFSWEEQNKKAARQRQCVHISSPSSIGVSSPLSLSKIACLPLIRVADEDEAGDEDTETSPRSQHRPAKRGRGQGSSRVP
eukprot:jgi/Botrbrau1/14527/Bobra.0223s0016.1